MGHGGLAPGTFVAGYRIGAPIGRGGMGVVYEAEHAALKVIAPELAADDEFRERFLREAQLAASLEHPSVLPIYDAGEEDGRLYLAMRRVRGADLAERLRGRGRLSFAEAVALFRPVAGALDTAHRQGLVHRDVKLQNILVEPSPDPGEPERVFLSDFGLSKKIGAATSLTRTGMFVGTLRYAAPEQLLGHPVDGRTDQYALACVLFECLCGQPPYGGDSEPEIMFGHVWQPVPLLSTRVPGVDPEVDRVLARGMAKTKEERFSTCAELVGAFAAAADRLGATRPAAGLLPPPPPAGVHIPAPPRPEPAGPPHQAWPPPLQPPASAPQPGYAPAAGPAAARAVGGRRGVLLVALGALLALMAVIAEGSDEAGSQVALAGLVFAGPPGLIALALGTSRSQRARRVWGVIAVLVGLATAVLGAAIVASEGSATAALLIPSGILTLAGGVAAARRAHP